MLRRRMLWLAWSLPIAAASPAGAHTAVSPKLRRWLGRRALAVLSSADRVQPFAVKPWPVGHPALRKQQTLDDVFPPDLPPDTPASIRGFPVYDVGPAQPQAFAQRLAALLLDERSYEPGHPPVGTQMLKGCIPLPGVAFRTWAARTSVDVLVCFTCDQVLIGRSTDKFSAKASHGDIDPSRAAWVALANEALPNVAKVRAIPPIRPERPRL